jgi:P22_AR N-terminal domain
MMMNTSNEDERSEAPVSENDIPEERASHQELIPFMDDELAAAMTATNTVYVSVPGVCKALGIKNPQPQVLRITRTKVLKKGLRRIPIHTRGGFQNTYCLRVDLLALWLAGIEPSRMRQDTAQQRALREKIEQYQEELAPEATRVFLRVIGLRATDLTPTASQEITAQEQETEQLAAVATFMREHLQAMLTMQDHTSLRLEHAIQLLETLIEQQESTTTKLAQIDERTQRLTPAHTRDVQLKVERISRKMNQQTPTITLEKARAITYGRLKTRFGAGSYKEINDDWYSEVTTYLNEEYSKASGGEQLPEQGSLF